MTRYHLEDALLELTYACSSDCVFCAKKVPNPGRLLNLQDWTKLLGELQSLSCTRVWLTGGEPMCAHFFWEILETAVDRIPEVVVLTSGTRISEEDVLRFARTQPTWIQMTLFSLDANLHDAITRDPGSHAKTMGAITACLRAGLAIRLKIPVLWENLACLPSVEDWGRARGIPVLPAMIVFPRMDGDLQPLRHAITNPEVIRRYLAVRRGRDYNQPPTTTSCDDLMDCPGARSHLAIGPAGDVYPCTPFPLFLDSVRERSLADIWRDSPSPATRRVQGTRRRDLARAPGCPVRWCRRCPGLTASVLPDFRDISEVACTQCPHQDGVGEEFYRHIGETTVCG